jgi:hypothetical protein
MNKVGRPAKHASEKLSHSMRTLVSPGVKRFFLHKMNEENLTEAQLLRLALFNLMLSWADAPLDDVTFKDVVK